MEFNTYFYQTSQITSVKSEKSKNEKRPNIPINEMEVLMRIV